MAWLRKEDIQIKPIQMMGLQTDCDLNMIGVKAFCPRKHLEILHQMCNFIL